MQKSNRLACGARVRLTAVVLGVFFLGTTTAQSAVTLTKSHVEEDNTGTPGELCEGDSVLVTIRAAVSGGEENFTLTDIIQSSYYSFWEVVQDAGTPAHGNEGALNTPGPNGRFSVSQVVMQPGNVFDFQYRATLRDNSAAPRNCGTATARNINFQIFTSNEDCVFYDCVPQGVPDIILYKTYTGTPSPVVGDPVSWTIELINRGTEPDTNVNVTDIVDASKMSAFSFGNFSRTPDNEGPGPNLDATWNTVNAGETISFDLQAVYSNCDFGMQDPICNQARVTSTGIIATEPDGERLSGPPGEGERRTCEIGTPGGTAELTEPVPKTVDNPNASVGETVEFSVVFENTGFCESQFGSFTDTLPAELQLDLGSVVITPPSAGVDNSAGNEVIVDGLVMPGAGGAGSSTVTITFQAEVLALPGPVCNQGEYAFGITNPTPTTEACIAGDPITAVKSHNDPNGDGTLTRNQQLQYTIHIENEGDTAVSDVRVSDTIPMGASFVSVDQTGGGTIVSTSPVLEIDNIVVNPGAANAVEVLFTVQEDGTLPVDADLCNVAEVTTTANSVPIMTEPVCVTIDELPCPTPPERIDPMLLAKVPPDAVEVSWPEEVNSVLGYRVYSVEADPAFLPANGSNGGFLECETNAQDLTSCQDPDGLQSSDIYYEVVGICGDGSEGLN